MTSHLYSVHTDMLQEAVARAVARYNLLAIPVVNSAIFVNMIIAATVGTLIPMFFKRIRVDLAIATGPFVTTAIDVVGISAYFLLAKILLPQ